MCEKENSKVGMTLYSTSNVQASKKKRGEDIWFTMACSVFEAEISPGESHYMVHHFFDEQSQTPVNYDPL